MLAQLIPQRGGPPVTLPNAVTIIGRSSKLCDLVIDHACISKLHCVLVKTDGLLYLRDLASTNGTRVNGQRVIRGALLPGDQLSFSGIVFRVHLSPDQDPVRVTQNDATEVVSIVKANGLEKAPTFSLEQSHSDVRFLRDSDLLLPD